MSKPQCPFCHSTDLLEYPSREVECQHCGKTFHAEELVEDAPGDKAPLVKLPETLTWNGDTYWLDISRDTFVHLTLASRAALIKSVGKILMRPPGGKFGGDAVYAISTVYGKVVPGTQSTHIKATKEDPLVAVVFKTRVIPERGFIEEVSWDKDVALTSLKVMPASRGLGMVRASPIDLSDGDMVVYDAKHRPKMAHRVAARWLSETRA